MQPQVSIIIPTYNRIHLVGETLDSVMKQTYQNWECIIVDDGSTDGTFNHINRIGQNDNRFVVLKRSANYGQGGNGARNIGLERAKGNLVMFLDSDDLLSFNCLKTRVEHTRKYPQADMHVFHTEAFTKTPGDKGILWNSLDGNIPLKLKLISRFVEQDMPWHTNGVLWNKDYLRSIGGWNEKLKAWQDWELHLRALFNNPKINISMDLPDNFYRLNVSGSIAASKDTWGYYNSIYKAIKSIEPYIVQSGESNLVSRFRYLVLRVFVHRPILNRDKKTPFNILIFKKSFINPQKSTFLKYLLLELLWKQKKIYRLAKLTRFHYYQNQVKERSTHLKLATSELFNPKAS